MKLLIPVIALLSTTAMAADLKWDVEGRFDYGNSTVKHEFADSTKNYEEKRSEFYSNIIRLNAVAVINDQLSARFRYRLSSDTASKNRDLTFNNVDFFYVDHKNQWFTSRIGKSNQVESLGREYFTAGTDYNTTAYGFGPAGAVGNTGYTQMNTAVYNQVNTDAGIYHVGYSAIYNAIEGQVITVAAFNPQKSTPYNDTAGGANDSKNSKVGFGAYYNGTFLDGLVQPTLGYTNYGISGEVNRTTPASNTPSGTNTLMTAGVRSQVAGFVIDADWKQYKKDNTATAAVTAAGATTEDKTTSIWANVAYTWDMFTPFVNYIHDKYDRTAANTATVGDYKRDAFAVGVQFKPFKESTFRYHVAYSSDVRKNELAANSTAETEVKAHQVVAGIKFDL